MERIKKDDIVVVLTGRNKGKRGRVIEIATKAGKVKVEGVAIATHHMRAKRRGEVSQVKQMESFIDISNVMPIEKTTDKPSRIGSLVTENGARVRVKSGTKLVV